MEQDFWGQGAAFPIQLQKGGVALAAGEESIRQSILLILGTSPGERVMRPDFGCGINELVFAPNDTSTATLVAFHVRESLLKWEPRIEVREVIALQDRDEPGILNITIDYVIRSTNTRRNLVYPFYLEGKK